MISSEPSPKKAPPGSEFSKAKSTPPPSTALSLLARKSGVFPSLSKRQHSPSPVAAARYLINEPSFLRHHANSSEPSNDLFWPLLPSQHFNPSSTRSIRHHHWPPSSPTHNAALRPPVRPPNTRNLHRSGRRPISVGITSDGLRRLVPTRSIDSTSTTSGASLSRNSSSKQRTSHSPAHYTLRKFRRARSASASPETPITTRRNHLAHRHSCHNANINNQCHVRYHDSPTKAGMNRQPDQLFRLPASHFSSAQSDSTPPSATRTPPHSPSGTVFAFGTASTVGPAAAPCSASLFGLVSGLCRLSPGTRPLKFPSAGRTAPPAQLGCGGGGGGCRRHIHLPAGNAGR